MINTASTRTRIGWLALAGACGLALLAALLLLVSHPPSVVRADPIEPPEGYPKLTLSTKSVTPTLAHTGGATLTYVVEIRNTGAYTAAAVTLVDTLPVSVTYNDDVQSNVPFTPTVLSDTLTWVGDVGFDATTVVSFSVSVSPDLSGTVRNTAVISHPLIGRPITLTADTVVADEPLPTIVKTSAPRRPGANKPLIYTLVVANGGQPAVDVPITVTDHVPLSTTLRDLGADGFTSPISDVVTWTRRITLDLGQSTAFTFSVDVGDVPSGTVITNQSYQVAGLGTGIEAGEPYTVTIVDPIFRLAKHTWPDPPGSNREMTYTLTLLNAGSLATGLVITDRVPAGVEYRRGGGEAGGVISWTLDSLDTGRSAEFTFTVYVSDVMDIPVVNGDYWVCSAEGVCQAGDVLTSVIRGPTFEAFVVLDPIAKKPGGGTGPVTPTLVVRNVGPGNALSATCTLKFIRISVSANDLYAIPAAGTPPPFPSVGCGLDCVGYLWTGDLAVGDAITFTTKVGQSTTGGGEGTEYFAMVVVTDTLGSAVTVPITGTGSGKVTHYANVVPTKSGPPVIGPGRVMTYTINVWNSGLSAQAPPILTDVVPFSTTFLWASDGGITLPIGGRTVVSWTLPALSTGERAVRAFSVRVDGDLISGTQIINVDYMAYDYGNGLPGGLTNGPPVTTTVKEVGLIDSYKEVTPTVALPGPGNVLTYYLHVVNSSPLSLSGVTVYDTSPWQDSTYQRDAVASAGDVISDIVSVQWAGDVAGFSSQIVTFTVLVDPDFQGPITNTAVISHPELSRPVEKRAIAYVTETPVLRISKSASPSPVDKETTLGYTIRVTNLGQQATELLITDTVPINATYLAGGELKGGVVEWSIPVLAPGGSRSVAFQVTAGTESEMVNDQYGATCAEGATAWGSPVVTKVRGGGKFVYLPLVLLAY